MNYQLEQTGDQVQSILNQAPTTEQDLRSEITRSTNKDEQLETAIGNEVTRAEGAEGQLQTAIGNEKTRAEGVEGELQTAIGNEKTRAEGVEGGLRTDVDAINGKIPAAASSSNKLADKDFVNSSISTNTADFKGTYSTIEELQAVLGANANDYAFVIMHDAAGNTQYWRYKYVTGTGWVFEYALNNSSFTADQWAAINSAITAALVAKLLALPTAASLTQQLNAIIASVGDEQTRAEGAEGVLRGNIAANATAIGNEKTRAEGAEGLLQTAIGNEKTRAEGAELVLQQNIDAEALLRGNADTTLQGEIDTINGKIPAAASSSNQLADKDFVNSSISTNTADFKGTYNSLQELEAVTANANDYGFVVATDAAGNTVYNRYKYVTGTGWVFEYALNNSSFTSDQWAAINSGITALLVTKLSGLPDADALALMFAAKQNVLTFDDAPTQNSSNPVKSGGVYTALGTKQPNLVVGTNLDAAPTGDSTNPVTSGGVWTAEKAITDKIPAEASDSNQLADKAWVAAQILANIQAFKGQFTTLAELEAVSSPKNGDLGIVRTKDSDGHDVFTFYQYMSSAWNVFYSLSYHPQTKPATTGTTGDYPYNGMGRVELAKNMVNGVNTLTQDMFYKGAVGSRVPNTNTIFVIRYDYELAEDITIPDGCVLQFEGGSVSGGGSYSLIGQNTPIVNENNKAIFKDEISVSGINIEKLPLSWCGGVADYNETSGTGTDNSDALEYALHLASNNGQISVFIDGDYYCATQIDLDVPLALCGNYYSHQGKPSGAAKKYESRIVVAAGITLFNIVGYNTYWYSINCKNVAFKGSYSTTYSSKLIYTAVTGGPARPHLFEACETLNFARVFDIFADTSVVADGTNNFNMKITNCYFEYNNEVIYSNGKAAVGNIHIYDNVIEHNGWDSPSQTNVTTNGVLHLDSFGSVIIENNLLEGQPNVINVYTRNGSVKIINNYFEDNSGDYSILVDGGGHWPGNSVEIKGNLTITAGKIILRGSYLLFDLDAENRNRASLEGGGLSDYSYVPISAIKTNITFPIRTEYVGYNVKNIMPTSVSAHSDQKIIQNGLECYKCPSNGWETMATWSGLSINVGDDIFFIGFADQMKEDGTASHVYIRINEDDSNVLPLSAQYLDKVIRVFRLHVESAITKIEIRAYNNDASNNKAIVSPVGLYINPTGPIENLRMPTFNNWFGI